jgi:DNA-binding transcriptional MerR regulator
MKSSREANLSIGQLAERFGLRTSLLRHWDAIGVLRPSARTSGRRRYTEDDAYRVGVILFCRQAGLTLPEIRVMLSSRRSKQRQAMLRHKAAELDRRIEETRAARRMAGELLHCTAPDPVACPRFRDAVDRVIPRRA